MRAMTECPCTGKEFHMTDVATENERRPTVDRRNGGTCSKLKVLTTMNEVGDDRADRRRGSADSSKVEQDRAAREKP